MSKTADVDVYQSSMKQPYLRSYPMAHTIHGSVELRHSNRLNFHVMNKEEPMKAFWLQSLNIHAGAGKSSKLM